MKKNVVLLLVIILVTMGNSTYSQETRSISQIRKDNLIKLLNYRFKGGYYTFEKFFIKTVTYPEVAKANCIVGISVVSLKVDCNGNLSDIKVKTPLGYGIDNEITAFLRNTDGQWNTCNDDKYTRFEIGIQFLLKGTETNTEDALLVIEDDNPGYLCNGDDYYKKKMEKYLEKEKYRKAIPYIDMMIRRNPYNSEYFELKKKAINGGD